MLCVVFFFKQKTAYEMRISDWSSDVCSSDLETDVALEHVAEVLDAVAEHQGAVDAHAEGEAGVGLRVDAAGDEDARVHDSTAAPLDPALAPARPAGVPVLLPGSTADDADHVALGGRPSEREVGGPDAGGDPHTDNRRGSGE